MRSVIIVLSTLVSLCLSLEKHPPIIDYANITSHLPYFEILYFPNNKTIITEQHLQNVTVEIPCYFPDYTGGHELKLEAHVGKLEIAEVYSNATIIVNNSGGNDSYCNYTFIVQGNFLGKTHLDLSLQEIKSNGEVNATRQIDGTYKIDVIRKKHVLDDIFTASVSVLVVFNTIGCGCALEMELLKRYLKRPLPMFIGFFCQFGFMPVIAYGMLYVLPIGTELGLGLIALGCSPGGGSSNMYTIVCEGDISLSITMTFINTVAALGMMPLWLLTARLSGAAYIPVTNIMSSLGLLVIPAVCGLLIRRFRPTWADKIVKGLKPFSLVIVIFICVFGVIANLYIFTLLADIWVLIAGLIVPFTGFFLSGLLTKAFCYNWKIIKTVMIETAIQNAGVAIVIVKFALPQPDADLASIMPIAANVFAPIPIWLYYFAILFYRKGLKRAKGKDVTKSEEKRSSRQDQMVDDIKEMQKGGTLELNGNITFTGELRNTSQDNLVEGELGVAVDTSMATPIDADDKEQQP